jgi:TonB family protein
MRGAAVAAGIVALAWLHGGAAAATRVPGTTLRFGSGMDRLDTTFVALPGDSTKPRRKGPVRFYGFPATATLEYHDQRLVIADLVADSISAAAVDYIEDELVREGYRRQCSQWQPGAHVCDWSGRTELHLEITGASVHARVKEAAPAPAVAVAAADPPGSSADPMQVTADGKISHVDYIPIDGAGAAIIDSCSAVRPDAARRAGIFGSVDVRVTVDAAGKVKDATIMRGIAELNDAALACARRYTFEPVVWKGRPREFVRTLTIRFTQ